MPLQISICGAVSLLSVELLVPALSDELPLVLVSLELSTAVVIDVDAVVVVASVVLLLLSPLEPLLLLLLLVLGAPVLSPMLAPAPEPWPVVSNSQPAAASPRRRTARRITARVAHRR